MITATDRLTTALSGMDRDDVHEDVLTIETLADFVTDELLPGEVTTIGQIVDAILTRLPADWPDPDRTHGADGHTVRTAVTEYVVIEFDTTT